MIATRWRRLLAALLLCVTLFVSACSNLPSSPYDQVQEETTGKNAPGAVSDESQKGGSFNKFFPGSQGDLRTVPAQEKTGFAEYKLNRGNTTVAMLSISDTTNLPEAAAKFQSSSRQVAGYPAVDVGSTQTAILVGDRYQVKVQSRDPSFTKEDRDAWLAKFDLKGLSRLK